jgi:toxin-antitoxin system PIN domain toxin
MKRQLVDVNVLFALVWPRHEDHEAAHAWFSAAGGKAWATSPLTQLGVLRLLTNPSVTKDTVGAASALAIVREATGHAGHAFWDLDRRAVAGLDACVSRLRGYRQWTDAALLMQATGHDGVLVTFDKGVKELAGKASGRVLLLKGG